MGKREKTQKDYAADKQGRPPKRDFGFVGRIVTLAVSLIALGFSVVCIRAIIYAPHNGVIIEAKQVNPDREVSEIIREEYQLYQSDLSAILAVAGIVFTVFSIGVPLMQYQFVTKEHVDALKEGLQEVTDADEQIKKAVADASAAQAAQEELKSALVEKLRDNRNEVIDQVNVLRSEFEERFQQQAQSLRQEVADQLRAVREDLAIAVTGQAPAKTIKLLPKIGAAYTFGPYQWKVLDVDITINRALLLSEDILEQRAYSDKLEVVTWETCALRRHLNGAFYTSFSAEDRARMVHTRNENPDNTWGRTKGKAFNTPGGNPTYDYIFLLSVADVLKYFPGLKLNKDKDGYEWRYGADERLVVNFNNDGSWWWLRSPGLFHYRAVFVVSDGIVDLDGNYVGNASGGVRPALWLNL